MSEAIITDQNFEHEVLKSDIPVLVDFWAPWCGPCQIQGPIIEAVSKEARGVKVGKMNLDENPNVPQTYGIMSIPTLIVFNGGKVVEQMVGVQQKEDLLKKLETVKAAH